MLIKLVSVATVLSKVVQLVNVRAGTPTRSPVLSPLVFRLQSKERATAGGALMQLRRQAEEKGGTGNTEGWLGQHHPLALGQPN